MFPSRPGFASLVAVLSTLTACSGSDGKGATAQGQNECGINSGYEGDTNCILAPASSEGFQLHVGPTNYDDPNDVKTFLLDPGKETVECYYLVAPNDHDMYNRQRKYRLRPHTHHLILKTGDATVSGWSACPPALDGSWGGSQSLVNDQGYGDIAPEDENFASQIPKNKPTAAELHYYNTGDKPILREAWVNFYEADPNHAWTPLAGIALIGFNGLNVPPQTTKDLRWSMTNTVDQRRVVSVMGHVHSHTQRMTAWRVQPDGTRTVIYELTDWNEPHGIRFNTVTQNPPQGTAGATEAGISGLLYLAANDSIEWECHVVNDLSTSLTFGNFVSTAEMCILFGSTPVTAWQAIPPILP